MRNYPTTGMVRKSIGGINVIHELSDTSTGFMHRLCAGGSLGEWVGYNSFAEATTNGRKFMACMGYYQPHFPEMFEVVGEA